MAYRIELQRNRRLVAARTHADAHHARRAFCALLRQAKRDGMVLIIHDGIEISPQTLLDHKRIARTAT
jgi:hypothetical protein